MHENKNALNNAKDPIDDDKDKEQDYYSESSLMEIT